MSVVAIDRVRQVMRHIRQVHATPLVERAMDIERVLGLLEDEDSRDLYQRELVFDRMRLLFRNIEDIVRCTGSISHEEWKGILDRTVRMRASGEIPAFSGPPCVEGVTVHRLASIYALEKCRYPRHVEVPKGVFIDCGAGCGETSVWAVAKGATVVYAFEPNPYVQTFLKENTGKFGQGRIGVMSLAVGGGRGKVDVMMRDIDSFDFARVVEREKGQVQCVSLDEWAKEHAVSPDFIKLDVEGCEWMALQGARETIARRKPRIAVAMYHNIADFWNFPLFLKRLVPEYRFWCRKTSLNAGFFLYASV
jgi:FkbM family methyltransferase